MNTNLTWEIKPLFPKSVFTADNVIDQNEIDEIKNTILGILDKSGSKRNELLCVDSTHRTNCCLHKEESLKPLIDVIVNSAQRYAFELGYRGKAISNIKVSSMWSNLSREGDSLSQHNHPNSFLSGAYYIEAPPESKIVFFDTPFSMLPEPQTYNDLSYKNYYFECLPNRLLLFKSDLVHSTPPQPKGQKIVISFNVISTD